MKWNEAPHFKFDEIEIGTTTLLEFPNGEEAIIEQEQILAPEKINKSEQGLLSSGSYYWSFTWGSVVNFLL